MAKDKKRKSISNKLRFDVFKRDLFICQYCGKTPPGITLEIDHIKPVCNGGSNNIDNLLTSCYDCNRGKGGTELSIIPETTLQKMALIKEREAQYKAYQKLLFNIERRLQDEICHIDAVYNNYFEGYMLADHFKNSSVRKFIDELGLHEVILSMEKACETVHHHNEATKYFCGICWNKIKSKS